MSACGFYNKSFMLFSRYHVGNVRTENSSRWASEYLDGFDHTEIHADQVVKNPAHRVAEELYGS